MREPWKWRYTSRGIRLRRYMTKVTDGQIRAASIDIDSPNKNVTITSECKRLGISRATYYRRLESLDKTIQKSETSRQNVTVQLPMTIEKLDNEANDLLEALKVMKTNGGYDTDRHDALDVIKETVRLVTGYRKALQSAQLYIDNRQQSVIVEGDVEKIRAEVALDLIERLQPQLCDKCRRIQI